MTEPREPQAEAEDPEVRPKVIEDLDVTGGDVYIVGGCIGYAPLSHVLQ